jgi:prevent-host-death family protein
MPLIKPISDLRNRSRELSDLVHRSDEPVFITRNGEGDMVVMSMAHFAKIEAKLELLSKLAAAQQQRATGDRGRPLAEVMRELRRKVNGPKKD